MKYFVIKCSVYHEGSIEENYGVMISDDDSREYICDISRNVDDVKNLVERLNSFHIEACHVYSIIEDFMYKTTCENTQN